MISNRFSSLYLFISNKAYSFTVSCLLYRDANTAISALEVLNQLLTSASAELAAWVSTAVPDAQV